MGFMGNLNWIWGSKPFWINTPWCGWLGYPRCNMHIWRPPPRKRRLAVPAGSTRLDKLLAEPKFSLEIWWNIVERYNSIAWDYTQQEVKGRNPQTDDAWFSALGFRGSQTKSDSRVPFRSKLIRSGHQFWMGHCDIPKWLDSATFCCALMTKLPVSASSPDVWWSPNVHLSWRIGFTGPRPSNRSEGWHKKHEQHRHQDGWTTSWRKWVEFGSSQESGWKNSNDWNCHTGHAAWWK